MLALVFIGLAVTVQSQWDTYDQWCQDCGNQGQLMLHITLIFVVIGRVANNREKEWEMSRNIILFKGKRHKRNEHTFSLDLYNHETASHN